MPKLSMPKARNTCRTMEYIPDADRMRAAIMALLEEPEPTGPSEDDLREIEPLAEEMIAEWSESD